MFAGGVSALLTGTYTGDEVKHGTTHRDHGTDDVEGGGVVLGQVINRTCDKQREISLVVEFSILCDETQKKQSNIDRWRGKKIERNREFKLKFPYHT